MKMGSMSVRRFIEFLREDDGGGDDGDGGDDDRNDGVDFDALLEVNAAAALGHANHFGLEIP